LIRGGDHRSPQTTSRNPATNDRRHISLTNPTTNKQQHMANIKPLGQRVLVKRIEADAVSAGGIVLPDTAKEKPQEAEVLSLGTGGKDEDGKTIEFTVKVGDKVLISKYGGTEVKVNGQEVLIINESDILGIVA
jgi:chaperonin GroES